jgi:hypothetical protein
VVSTVAEAGNTTMSTEWSWEVTPDTPVATNVPAV